MRDNLNDIKLYMKEDGTITKSTRYMKERHPVLYNKIVEYTKDNVYAGKYMFHADVYCYIHQIQKPHCKMCSNPVRYSSGKFKNYCSNKCRANDPDWKKQHSEAFKNGKIDIVVREEKRKKTSLERTGYTNSFKDPAIREKGRLTNLERYGVEHAIQLDEYKKKRKMIYHNRYGTEHPSLKHITHLEHWWNKEFIIEYFLDKDKCFKLKDFMKYFNCCQPRAHTLLKELNINYSKSAGSSQKEKLLYNQIKAKYKNIRIEHNTRDYISPLELDIVLPDYNVAIEFNGIYWHSVRNNLLQDKYRHHKKAVLCRDNNLQLLHCYEDINIEYVLNILDNIINRVDNNLQFNLPKEEEVVIDLDYDNGLWLETDYECIDYIEPQLIECDFELYNSGYIIYKRK